MALSILQCGSITHGLWDSKTESFLMTGTLGEMETWKDAIEKSEQAQQNEKHFEELRDRYIAQLMAGGNSKEEATTFLKERMPFLW